MPRFRRQRKITPAVKPRLTIALILGLLLVGLPRLQNARTIVAAASVNVNAKRRTVAPDARYVPGEVLVRFRSDGDAPAASIGAGAKSGERKWMSLRSREERAEIAAEIERFDGSELVEGLRLARVRPEDTLAAVEAFAERPDVLYAEPNYIWRKDATPNDPRFPEMYALKNTGQSGGFTGADIDAEPAWDITTGSNSVVVGVIDSGVDINHQDLKDNIWTNPGETPNNGVDDDGNGYVDDTNGWDFYHNDRTVFDNESGDDHATHVAGTIGARGNNGVGTVGVNWQVSIMSLKVLGPDGGGTVAMFVQAYNYARAMRERGVNIRVLNNSYGGADSSQAARDAISQLNQAGILFVASAGNDAADNIRIPHYPSNYDLPNVISVAATDRYDSLSSFSNFSNRNVTMAAPGSSILSTTPNNNYAVFSGTSMASPHVSGAAALVCAAHPGIPLQQLRGVIAYSGDDSSTSPNLFGLRSKVATGRRLNVLKALQGAAENDQTPPGTVKNLSSFATPIGFPPVGGRNLSLSWVGTGDDGDSGQPALYEISFLDADTGVEIFLGTSFHQSANPTQSGSATIPYRHFNGTIIVRAVDNVGNRGAAASVAVKIERHIADPYIMTLSAPGALSTGGEKLATAGAVFEGDDKYSTNYPLPFNFPYHGGAQSSVIVSTNGALYFTNPPKRPDGDADDAESSVAGLNGQRMIAGMWDDIVVDTKVRPADGIYVVKPNADAIIFLWQGATYDGDKPVNFEIELRKDGTITFRYGDGNTGLFPVVGISGGEPDAYVVESHTLERSIGGPPKSLTNAQTVTFAVRQPVARFNVGSTTDGVSENQLSIAFTVSRSGNTSAAQSVDYATGNGTAVAGEDYVAASGTLTFNSGESSKTVTVSIINDTLLEPTENFSFTISNPTNAAELGSTITKTVQIFDNDAPVNLLVERETKVTEGNSGTTGVAVRVGIHTPSQVPVSVNYATEDGSATAGGDYTAASGTLTFAPGETSKNIAIQITGDAVAEGDEFFFVRFSSPVNAMIPFPLSAVIISNDDGTPTAPAVQFKKPINTSVGGFPTETQGRVEVFVERIGDASAPITVPYSTMPDASFVKCDVINKIASERCDFSTTVGVLRFGAGETSKSFIIPVANDGFVEGEEMLTVTLGHPIGAASPGVASTAVVLISDDDQATPSAANNPFHTNSFFVRQHYLDFLAREPDAPGLTDWQNVLNGCGPAQGGLGSPSGCDRVHVSSGFYRSPEFTDRGYFVYRFYEGSLGRLPKYAEFIPDMASISGFQTVAENEASKTEFINGFVNRSEFTAKYAGLMTAGSAAQFVAKLEQTAGVTIAEPLRSQLIAEMSSGQKTAAQTLRAFVESQQIYDRFFFRGFVAMQYFGYLRRDPEAAGYNDWVDVMTNGRGAIQPKDYRHMILGFMYSIEYRERFGKP
ncbi:MAG: S8 family serine peptidase [Acidobacteriota bacterium]|nr:S8 family serine peptidase [Acidobacteriota bacterium]